MNKETRIKKIQEIMEREEDSSWKQEIPWEDELQRKSVYKIPLNLLVYNKYNGRILSRTKSLENQKNIIDAETDEGKLIIEKFLWNSKPKRNETTKKSLAKHGQEKVGIITKDGIIIDGNRRAMLLNKIEHIDTFKTVVLPVTLEENPDEIEKFETKYQLGEDRKLDYNPIEIYLKIQNLYKHLSGKSQFSPDDVHKPSIKKIYEWVGDYKNINSEKDIEYTLSVIDTMDDYLDYLEYNGIYVALDEREEQFRGLTLWLDNLYGENSKKAFDNYKDNNVDELKALCFDLIRIKFKNEKFRYIAQGRKQNHFFGNKSIWSSVQSKHLSITQSYEDDEPPIDYDSGNLEVHLNSRDADYKTAIGNSIAENIDNHYQQLRNVQERDQPEKLLKKSIDSFKSINKKHKAFANPDVLDLLEKLGDEVFSSLADKSPSRLLSHIVKLLESIDVDEIPEAEVDDVLEKTKRIQQLGYRINKKL